MKYATLGQEVAASRPGMWPHDRPGISIWIRLLGCVSFAALLVLIFLTVYWANIR